jgi:hypothetical protein
MSGSNGRACGHDKGDRPKVGKPEPNEAKAAKPAKAKPAKAKQKPDARASNTDDRDNGRQPATAEKPRREPKNAHRLRRGRSAR